MCVCVCVCVCVCERERERERERVLCGQIGWIYILEKTVFTVIYVSFCIVFVVSFALNDFQHFKVVFKCFFFLFCSVFCALQKNSRSPHDFLLIWLN